MRATVGEPCRFHDLRHSHVALIIEAGEHPKTIVARLGHTSVRTVLDVYGHLFEGIARQQHNAATPSSHRISRPQRGLEADGSREDLREQNGTPCGIRGPVGGR